MRRHPSHDETIARLRSLTPPDRDAAAARAWPAVARAFADREPAPPLARARRRLAPSPVAVTASLALLFAALALTPPGEAVGRWVRHLIAGRATPHAALTSLPARGRLLIVSDSGPWIVAADGSRRRLGAWASAGFSPGGRFLVVTSTHQVAAVDPRGRVRWAIGRAGPISDASWSAGNALDTRVAYLDARDLHVVAGDGTGDRLLAPRVAPVAPAWRPGVGHVLAYADRRGEVWIVDVDLTRVLGRARSAIGRPSALAWSPDGRRLAVLGRSAVVVFSARGGRPASRTAIGSGLRATALVWTPDGHRLAILRERGSGGDVVMLRPGSRPSAPLSAVPGGFGSLAVAPDGRWLALTWPRADELLFLGLGGHRGVRAVANAGRQFASPGHDRGSPAITAWCCG